MERLSQLHRLCEIEHDMGAFYSPVVSWLSSALIQYVAVVTQEMRCWGSMKQKEEETNKKKKTRLYQINRINMWENVTV